MSSQLKVAWVYHMKPAGAPRRTASAGRRRRAGSRTPAAGRGRGRGGSGFRSSEVTPLVINGTMYLATPYFRVVAVDPTTGKEIWAFQLPSGNPSTRGVEYWPGDARTPAQIVFGSSDGKLYSLDAKTGKPNEAFGDNGIVNLNTPEIMQGLPGRNALSSPPIVYKNLVITGGTTQENPPTGPAGDVRAWDMHTGKLVWTFHSIPRAGEKVQRHLGRRQLEESLGRQRVGIHDRGRAARHRLHAVRRALGRPVRRRPRGRQSFQHQPGGGGCEYRQVSVAFPAGPSRHLGCRSHGRAGAHRREAGRQDDSRGGRDGEVGLLFLLDRVTGKPIYGVEERPVPQSEVPLERVEDAAVSAQAAAALADDDGGRGRRDRHAGARSRVQETHGRPATGRTVPARPYNRLGVRFPGNHGGVNWGGTSFNPQLGYLFVNTNELGQVSGMKDHEPKSRPGAGERAGQSVDPDGPYEGVPGGGRFSIGAIARNSCRASSRHGDS